MFGVLAMLLHHPLVFISVALAGVFLDTPSLSGQHAGVQQHLDALSHGRSQLAKAARRLWIDEPHNASGGMLPVWAAAWRTPNSSLTESGPMEIVGHPDHRSTGHGPHHGLQHVRPSSMPAFVADSTRPTVVKAVATSRGSGHHKVPFPFDDPEFRQNVLVPLLFVGIFGIVLVSLGLVASKLIFAFCYKSKVTDMRRPLLAPAAPNQETADFQHGLCSCFDDGQICLHSCFCLICRAGDTHAAAGLGDFWSVILCYYGIMFIGGLADGLLGLAGLGRLAASLFWAYSMAKKRQELRTKLGLNHQGGGCEDLLAWWCCTPCVTAQEARSVDLASGVDVRCCCSLVPRATLPVVGAPVASLNEQMMWPGAPVVATAPAGLPPVPAPMATLPVAVARQLHPGQVQVPIAVATVIDVQPPVALAAVALQTTSPQPPAPPAPGMTP